MSAPAKTSKGKQRSAARLAAVQALYDMELSGNRIDVVMTAFLTGGVNADLDGELVPADSELFKDIMRGVTARQEDLDKMIGSTLSGSRTVVRLEVLMRAILRCGAYELIARGDIDPPLTISEYLSVATSFFSGPEPKFVNGVLDKLAKTIREDDLSGDNDVDDSALDDELSSDSELDGQ